MEDYVKQKAPVRQDRSQHPIVGEKRKEKWLERERKEGTLHLPSLELRD